MNKKEIKKWFQEGVDIICSYCHKVLKEEDVDFVYKHRWSDAMIVVCKQTQCSQLNSDRKYE